MRLARHSRALAALTGAAIAATLVLSPSAAQAAVIPDCTSAAPTAADAAFAAAVRPTLTGTLAGSFNASEAACTRVIVGVVKTRGLPLRAATIALTAAIVESRIQNLNFGDLDSLGLFQQRPSAGWGTESEILDPVHSTNKFLSVMLQKYPNNTWLTAPIGEVCQAVQVSGFPDRYAVQAPDGGRIAAAAWTGHVIGDFDADNYTDLALYRPNSQTGSTWWVKSSRTGTAINGGTEFGGASDKPAAGDYDGDGQSDLALYRRDCSAGSSWWVKSSRTGATLNGGTKFGGCTDIPAPGDYDGDGQTDLALYRRDCSAGSSWWVKSSRTGAILNGGTKFGGCTDIPAPGDYDGDRSTDLALYRRDCSAGSSWWVKSSQTGAAINGGTKFGGCADIPVTSS
jgi:hypothetical protein